MIASPGKIFLGVDVSKATLDIAVSGRPRVVRIRNETQAIEAFLAAFDPEAVALVAYEPTGGYERALDRAAAAAGLPHHRIHPDRLVAFRRQKGIKAKTDAADARLILAFAEQELAAGVRPRPDADEVLDDLVTRRDQIVAARQGERCRLDRARAPLVRRQIERHLAALEADQEEVEAALGEHVEAREPLRTLAARLQTLKGIGPVSAWTLMARLPQLGRADRKEIASLLGLAPRDRSSGRTAARAATGHGDKAVRRVLFNAARSAIVHNPVIREDYRRIVDDNGRPKPVALVAAMRKMIVILNAMVRDRADWNPGIPRHQRPKTAPHQPRTLD